MHTFNAGHVPVDLSYQTLNTHLLCMFTLFRSQYTLERRWISLLIFATTLTHRILRSTNANAIISLLCCEQNVKIGYIVLWIIILKQIRFIFWVITISNTKCNSHSKCQETILNAQNTYPAIANFSLRLSYEILGHFDHKTTLPWFLIQFK